jgi:hypothetical protein
MSEKKKIDPKNPDTSAKVEADKSPTDETRTSQRASSRVASRTANRVASRASGRVAP